MQVFDGDHQLHQVDQRLGLRDGSPPDLAHRPRHRERLLRDEGEVIVEVVRKHWVVYIIPALIVLVGLLCWVVMPFIDVSLGWAPLLVGAGLILWGVGRALDRNLDQFVIANMRVFRIHGTTWGRPSRSTVASLATRASSMR